MRPSTFLSLLCGDLQEARETLPSPQAAARARRAASNRLRGFKNRHTALLLRRGHSKEAIEAVKVFADPQDPCSYFVASSPRPPRTSKYDPLLRMPVGSSLTLDLGTITPIALYVQLSYMAKQQHAVLGSRPCWAASRLPDGRYLITRHADGLSPATLLPRGPVPEPLVPSPEPVDLTGLEHLYAPRPSRKTK